MHTLSFGQQKQLDSLLTKFDRYRINNPQEKLYIHTDQELYLTGETLWFKIYAVDGALHCPVDISKVAYVEILSKENVPVLQAKISLKKGEGDGAIFLPASISSGNYSMRAYTQWMKNFDPEYFFWKEISIVNTFRKLDVEKEKPADIKPFNAQFYPEGGDLVYGLESKVAFQVTDSQGKGIDFSGLILNAQNDTIAYCKPLKYGIGHFMFTPAPDDVYRAVITDLTGNSQTIGLPAPKAQGYVMEVRDSTADLLAINIAVSELVARSRPTIHFFIHARQIVSTAGVRQLEGIKTTMLINKKDLHEGISHITILDSDLNPICERLYFKQVNKKLSLDIQVNQSEFGVRRKVLLSISAGNDSTTYAGSSLSVAVVKSDSLQGDVSGNIFNYLWLSSDLQGNVESPEYYAGSGSPELTEAIDNVMLTHGWRRFNWKDVFSKENKLPEYLPEYRGHLIRGTVVDQAGQPAPGIGTYLSTPSKNIQLYTARSKSSGEVQYEMKDFWGAKKVIVQTNSSVDSTYKINLHNPFSNAKTTRRLSDLQLNAAASKTLLARSVAMQVQDVYYGEKSLRFTDPQIDSTSFYGKANETYFLDDYTRFTVMEEVMREYVAGVMVRKRRDGFHFLVLNTVRKSLFQDNPLVLLDGMPIFDVDRIMEYDPLKVKKLEVLTSRYYLGPLHFPGVVSYSTYTGDLGGFVLDPKSISLDYEGLQRQRIFYSPQYESQKQRESRMPDRRHLLYWNPQVSLDQNGKQQLEFFTSDLTGNFTIVVEGLNKNGYSGSKVSSLVVKQFSN